MKDKQQYIMDNIDDILSIQNKLKKHTQDSQSDVLILLYSHLIFIALFVKFSYDIILNIIGKLNHSEMLIFSFIFISLGFYLATIPYKIFKNKKLKKFKHDKMSNNVYKKIFYYYYEQAENKKKDKNSKNFINSLSEKEIDIIENLEFVDMRLNIKYNKMLEYINNLSIEEKVKNKDKIIKLINNKNLHCKSENSIIEELKTFYLENNSESITIYKNNLNKNNIIRSI